MSPIWRTPQFVSTDRKEPYWRYPYGVIIDRLIAFLRGRIFNRVGQGILVELGSTVDA